ncbi:unnamed protein product [Rotaria sordida]|uniref:PCI domain-containing protein n=1 Tax=Rotaria sordida TaxID=392033 RepID=A0A814RUM3_9BILA|nr:unnamed protein product [Rotaria sordida]
MYKNRFFADGNSSSSEENSDDEQQIKIPIAESFVKSYLINNDDNDDAENIKRIVRSEKDKRYEEIEENIKKIEQVIRIRDIKQVYECFENLIKVYDKARQVIEKEQIIPRFYIKILVQLEDFVNECWNNKDWCNEFNKKNLKILRQKFRQYIQIESFQNEINSYREKPDDDVIEINETSSSDDFSSENNNDSIDNELSLNQSYVNFFLRKPDSQNTTITKRREEDILKFDNDKEILKKLNGILSTRGKHSINYHDQLEYLNNIRQYVKKQNLSVEIDIKILLIDITISFDYHQKENQYSKFETWKRILDSIEELVTLISENDHVDINEYIKILKFDNDKEILKKLNEILSTRGKHSINYHDQFEYLNNLRQYVKKQNLSVEIDMKILLIDITISFDYHQKENQYSKFETWKRILDSIEELVTLISENDHVDINEYIKDDMITMILKMNEEFTKILRNIDYHSQNYIEQLKDEFRICSIINQVKNYFELKFHENNKIIQSEHLCTIYLCLIEHIYYKYNKTSDQSSIILIDHLCKYIYTNNTLNHVRTQANLYHIYHLSLHDYYNEARNLMLMSHIQETIHLSNISIQILYNRTMVQLGLCAFRCGSIHETHQILINLQPENRMKELLGQNIHIKEQQYLLPFHMHINLQLIECIYLISAMLIEIPSIHKHSISKHFHIVMSQGEKQFIFESMETMREHIIAASHALKIGDWKTCVKYLINDKMNKQIWNLMPQGTIMFEMLINKIKQESLRIYLFTNSMIFDSISISNIADMFELSIRQVYEIICKMIINEELMASIEDSNQIVILNQNRLSQTQILSNVRMYLSDAYQAFDKWDESLSSEILQKTNISKLLIDVEHKLIRKKYVSSLDIKISLVRNYLDLGQKERLLFILQDKVKYGIFLDRFPANLLLNAFLLEKKYKKAAQVCIDLMLQDESDDQLTGALATDEDFKSIQIEEEDEDIVKVKVNFVHNHTNDDHFDLTDKCKLLGKTIAYLSRDANDSSIISLPILGNILYKKFGRVCDILQTILNNDQLQVDETIIKILEKELNEYVYNPIEAKERLRQSPYRRLELIPEAARDIIKKKFLPQLRQKNKIVSLNLKEFVEKNLIEIATFADKYEQ